jgi:pyocin large subunit-like protein
VVPVHGFPDQQAKDDHFQKHGHEFGAPDADAYEALAIAFLAGAKGATMVECMRSAGDRVRLDKVTKYFGVVASDGYIRTFFKCNKMIHRMKSDLQYFKVECRK